MAKRTVDPTLRELVRAIEESGRASVPIALTVRGTVLHGELVSQQRYFADLAAANPLVSALEPAAGLLGKDYRKETHESAHHYLHLRGGRVHPHLDGVGALWRIRLTSVDAWTVHDMAPQAEDADGSEPTRTPNRRTSGGSGKDQDRRDDQDDTHGPFAKLLHTS